MIKFIWLIVNIAIITLIYFRVPKNNTGLSSFANKVNIFGSSTVLQEFFDYVTTFLVFIYFIFAVYFNYNSIGY